MKKLPKHCQGHSVGFFDMVKAKLGRFVQIPVDECFEYHKALRATPHSQVTPVQVSHLLQWRKYRIYPCLFFSQAFSMTFAQLFVTPLGAIGESLSLFFAGTMRHVPILLWPVIIVIILIIVIIVSLMYSRYEVHLPFMMGSLRPSPHAAVSAPAHISEPLEHAVKSSTEVKALQDRIKDLETKLTEKETAAIEPPSSPPPIGFREDLLQ